GNIEDIDAGGAKLEEGDWPDLSEAVSRVAETQSPLKGKISGTGRFTPNPDDGTVPFYASADVPGLNEFRSALVSTLKIKDVPIREEHGFTPHATIRYLDSMKDKDPLTIDEPIPVEFNEVVVSIGEHNESFSLN